MVESRAYTWSGYEQGERNHWLGDFILVCAKGVTALGRKYDLHLTWYSSTHKKGDSDFLRSEAIRIALIG